MKLLFRFCFIWFIPFTVFSQEKAVFSVEFSEAKMATVLMFIEETYNVKFSYQDNLINTQTITLTKKKRTLDELLNEISNLIKIDFERLDNRYIFLKKSVVAEEGLHLKEVVINGYLTKGISKKKNATFEIHPKKLEILPGLTEPDIFESIQQFPGVVSPNETATGLIVRGGSSDQNRIIWDGINIYHNGHLFGMISAFNPNITEKVIFHNKGTNPKFGERISSVIDISTKTKLSNKVEAEFGINAINFDAYLSIPIIKDKLSMQVSYRRSYEDKFETSTFRNLEEKVFQHTAINETTSSDEKFKFKDYNLKLNFQPNKKNTFALSVIHIDNDLEHIFEDLTLNKLNENILDTENEGYSISWNKKWNAKVSHQTQAFLSKYRLNYNFITTENLVQISDFDKRNKIYDSGLSSELQIKINEKDNLSLGYQYTLKDISYEIKETADLVYILDRDKTIINTHSFYSNYTYRNSKIIDLDGGIRLNYYKELKAFRVEPRIVINKDLLKNLKLQITGELKNQIVSQIEETVLSNLSLENKLWRLADGDKFPIINSKQVSAGFLYSNNGWSIDIDHYYKKIKGITTLSIGYLNPEDSRFHVGNQKVFGTDFYLEKEFKKIKAWVSYSYTDVKNKFEGLNNNKYFTSSIEIKHAISASLSYKVNQLQFALGWKWQSGRPYTESLSDFEDNDFDFEGINTEKLKNYHRLDFSSTYKFNFSKKGTTRGKIGFSIRNIYNRKSHLSREYTGNNAINDPIIAIDKFSLGITPNFLFRVYW
ncbi:TonB-dependent receptor domain-containing protein [Lutibacter sp.]